MEQKEKISKITLTYFVVLVLFIFVRLANSFGMFNFLDGWWGEIFTTGLIQVVILFLVPLCLFCIISKTKPHKLFKNIKFRVLNFKSIIICIIIGILVYFLNVFVSSLFSGILNIFGFHAPESSGGVGVSVNSVPIFLLYSTLVAVLPAFCEEFLHRGILLQGMRKESGIKSALLFSSILFGLTHLNIQQFFYATILGYIMGLFVLISDSIFPAMIIHFCNNFINCYVTFANNTNLFGKELSNLFTTLMDKVNPIYSLLIIAIILFIILFSLVLLSIALYNQTQKSKARKLMKKLKENPDLVYDNVPVDFTESEFKLLTEQLKPLIINNETDFKLMFSYFVPPDTKTLKSLQFSKKIFLIASIFLGSIITLSTFVWGLL